MSKPRLILLGLLLASVSLYVACPWLIIEPTLLAEASKDILHTNDFTPIDPPKDGQHTFIPLDKILCAGTDGFRFRVVGNSHHNEFINYNGSIYVKVNRSLYHHRGGYCAPAFISPVEDMTATTEKEFTDALVARGFKLIKTDH